MKIFVCIANSSHLAIRKSDPVNWKEQKCCCFKLMHVRAFVNTMCKSICVHLCPNALTCVQVIYVHIWSYYALVRNVCMCVMYVLNVCIFTVIPYQTAWVNVS